MNCYALTSAAVIVVLYSTLESRIVGFIARAIGRTCSLSRPWTSWKVSRAQARRRSVTGLQASRWRRSEGLSRAGTRVVRGHGPVAGRGDRRGVIGLPLLCRLPLPRAPGEVGDTYFKLVCHCRSLSVAVESGVLRAAECGLQRVDVIFAKLADRHAGNEATFTVAGLAPWLHLASTTAPEADARCGTESGQVLTCPRPPSPELQGSPCSERHA